MRLTGVVEAAKGLSPATVDRMYELFAGSYALVTLGTFRRDLDAKSHVILISDEAGILRGFSTFVVWPAVALGEPLNVLFSGDTVVEREAWGSRALAIAWLEASGAAFARDSNTPLYWLLTTKGQRTFRFLPLFFERFAPRNVDGDHDPARLESLAHRFFGNRYDAARGILAATGASGQLHPGLADIPAKDLRRDDVSFFVDRNPGYRDGDELVCLARLHPSNLRPGVRRYFSRGVATPSLLD